MKVYAAYYLEFQGLDLRFNSEWNHRDLGLFASKAGALKAGRRAWADQLANDGDASCFVHDLNRASHHGRRRWYVEEKQVNPE